MLYRDTSTKNNLDLAGVFEVLVQSSESLTADRLGTCQLQLHVRKALPIKKIHYFVLKLFMFMTMIFLAIIKEHSHTTAKLL